MRTVNTGTMRGLRIGAGPPGEAERGDAAPCVTVSYWCANNHETAPNFAETAEIPGTWVCMRCGQPAGQDEGNPPAPERVRMVRHAQEKTHLDHVKERRSKADGEAILAWALDRLRSRHGIRPARRQADVHGPVIAATLSAAPASAAGTAAPASLAARRQPRRRSRAQRRQRSRR
jgi:hypothetical protein